MRTQKAGEPLLHLNSMSAGSCEKSSQKVKLNYSCWSPWRHAAWRPCCVPGTDWGRKDTWGRQEWRRKDSCLLKNFLYPKGGINFPISPVVTGPVEDFLSNSSIMLEYRTSIVNLATWTSNAAPKSCVAPGYLLTLSVPQFFHYNQNEMSFKGAHILKACGVASSKLYY